MAGRHVRGVSVDPTYAWDRHLRSAEIRDSPNLPRGPAGIVKLPAIGRLKSDVTALVSDLGDSSGFAFLVDLHTPNLEAACAVGCEVQPPTVARPARPLLRPLLLERRCNRAT